MAVFRVPWYVGTQSARLHDSLDIGGPLVSGAGRGISL